MPTLEELASIFNQYGVPIGNATESPAQRLARIQSEVNSGRSLDSVIRSVQGIAEREGWTPNQVDPGVQQQIAQVQQQINNLQSQPISTTSMFDPEFAAAGRGLDRQLTDLAASIQQRLGSLASDRTRAVTESERNNTDALRALQARMSDQGILRSGINVRERSEQNQNYLRGIDQIQDLYQRGVTEAELERTQGTNAINAQREVMQAQNARLNAQHALEQQQQRATSLAGHQSNLEQLQQQAQQQSAGNSITNQIRDMFLSNRVPIASDTETAQQRLQRITQEVGGGRSLDSVMNSIQGIAARQQQQPIQQRDPRMKTSYGGYKAYG